MKDLFKKKQIKQSSDPATDMTGLNNASLDTAPKKRFLDNFGKKGSKPNSKTPATQTEVAPNTSPNLTNKVTSKATTRAIPKDKIKLALAILIPLFLLSLVMLLKPDLLTGMLGGMSQPDKPAPVAQSTVVESTIEESPAAGAPDVNGVEEGEVIVSDVQNGSAAVEEGSLEQLQDDATAGAPPLTEAQQQAQNQATTSLDNTAKNGADSADEAPANKPEVSYEDFLQESEVTIYRETNN